MSPFAKIRSICYYKRHVKDQIATNRPQEPGALPRHFDRPQKCRKDWQVHQGPRFVQPALKRIHR